MSTVVRYQLICQVLDDVVIPADDWMTTVESLPSGAVVDALAALIVSTACEPKTRLPAKTTFPLVKLTELVRLNVGQLMNQFPAAKVAGIDAQDWAPVGNTRKPAAPAVEAGITGGGGSGQG